MKSEKNFSEQQISKLKLFYLRGGFDYKKVNGVDKVMMNLLKLKLKATRSRIQDEEGLLNAYDVPEYHMSKEKIKPLIEYVHTLEK